jgi:mechanosensitive ion channel-like protein
MVHVVLVFLLKALAFTGILAGGWLAGGPIRKIVAKLLVRAGFDKVVERGGVRAALARSQHDASDIVAKLVFYAIMLFALRFAFGIWGPNPVSALLASVIAWLPQGFVAIVIVVVAAAIARAVKDIISSALGGMPYGKLLAGIANVFIIGLGVIAALNQVGVTTTVTTPVLIAVLATGGGVIGGALARPLQDRWASWPHRMPPEPPVIAEQGRARETPGRTAAPRAEIEQTLSIPNQ